MNLSNDSSVLIISLCVDKWRARRVALRRLRAAGASGEPGLHQRGSDSLCRAGDALGRRISRRHHHGASTHAALPRSARASLPTGIVSETKCL